MGLFINGLTEIFNNKVKKLKKKKGLKSLRTLFVNICWGSGV